MERTLLLNELVALDQRIIAATGCAGRAISDREFQRYINQVIEMRKERGEIKAKLDALDRVDG